MHWWHRWFVPNQGLICAAEAGRDSCQAGSEDLNDDDEEDDDDDVDDDDDDDDDDDPIVWYNFDQGDSGGPLVATAARHSNSTQKRWTLKKKNIVNNYFVQW